MNRPIATLLVLAAAGFGAPAPAAGAGGDEAFLRQYAATYRFRLGRPRSIRPTPDGDAVLFLRSGPRSFEQSLYAYDVATGEERRLLSPQQLLGDEPENLTEAEKARRERRRLAARGITSFQLSEDGRRVLVPLSGALFVYERGAGSVRKVPTPDGPAAVPQLSPDGDRVAFVRDGDLYVTRVDRGLPQRLTDTASDTVSSGLAEFIAQEEMRRHRGFWWSPDSRRILYQITDTEPVERLHILDATRPEQPPDARPYPRAGTANAEVTLALRSVDGGASVPVTWDRAGYPYLAKVAWTDNAPPTILVQNRRQTEAVLLAVDPDSGRTSPLLVERDDAWVAIDPRMPEWLEDGSGFLWTTERRGARQLELRGRDGGLREVLTPLDSGFESFLHVDEKRGRVYFTASRDPTETHLWVRPPAADAPPRRLSDTPGVHGATFAEDGSVFVHAWSNLGGEAFAVRGADGAVLGALTSVAEIPRGGFDLRATTQFVEVGEEPKLHAVVIRPRDPDAETLPVIVHVYGGPTGRMVRKQARRYLLDQWIADRGYVVVSIDGRGTPGRGRGWQRAVKGDLIDLPLRDQVRGLRALGARYDDLDLSRAGIYGWSFGGYFSAMAVMRRPDVFRAAVAGAPVTDWRDYDTHYTERYMGLPEENPSGYRATSALTWADELSQPLLLIHGAADDNVYFMHTMKLAEALFRAGRPFELLPLPAATHMVPDPEIVVALYGRIMAFFDRHLRR